MIDRRHAEEALEQLSAGIAAIIEEVHPVTVAVLVGGDRSRENLLAEAGEDVLTLVSAMRVFRRRRVDAPPLQGPPHGD